MNKKAVVFGGSGFLGSHVADELTKANIDVIIVDQVESKYKNTNQKMIIADILDTEKLDEIINGANYVYHFAGVADVKESVDNPVSAVKNNILGTTLILDACKKWKIDRFLFASTIYVYSEMGSFYRSTKQSCELLIENYSKEYELDYSILRFGSLYGRRANQFNFIYSIIKSSLLNGTITRQGDGNEIREYIHVTDAARASVEILDDKYKNSNIILTGTQKIKIRDLINMISEMFENKIKINYSNEKLENHYEITPYTFKPRLGKKYVSNHYRDLGEGILDTIYDIYKDLKKEKAPVINLPDENDN